MVHSPLFAAPLAVIFVKFIDFFVVKEMINFLEHNFARSVAMAWLIKVKATFLHEALASC